MFLQNVVVCIWYVVLDIRKTSKMCFLLYMLYCSTGQNLYQYFKICLFKKAIFMFTEALAKEASLR